MGHRSGAAGRLQRDRAYVAYAARPAIPPLSDCIVYEFYIVNMALTVTTIYALLFRRYVPRLKLCQSIGCIAVLGGKQTTCPRFENHKKITHA